jgi:flavin reductase (DIM6/NTAB) family NADH-FMN oxidoreductase RutF
MAHTSGRATPGGAAPQDGAPSPGRMRELRSRFPAGVTVVAFREADGLRGVTVSSFACVSVAPPLVLVCLGRDLEAERLLAGAAGFAVSVLSDRQELLAQRFAGRGPLVDGAFSGVPYFARATGAPLLEGALAWFDCRPDAAHGGGDHTIFVGRVVWAAAHPGAPAPLVYFGRHYADLGNLRLP